MATVLLKNLNGGKGVAGGLIEIQDRTGASTTIDLSEAETLQDVIDAINSSAEFRFRHKSIKAEPASRSVIFPAEPPQT